MTAQQMGATVVHLSHILITHRDVTDPTVSFSRVDWRTTQRSSRSRAEALALAQSIASELERHPGDFASAAIRHSDDLATRDRAGSLGGVSVLRLQPWGAVLDALSALQFDEVSGVIETQHGFHLLLRRRPPPAETLSGSHLVIGYDDAGWLRKVVARRSVPARTRQQALALAQALADQARQAPERFGELVERYSEHRDAEEGGDLGLLSTLTPKAFAREVEILSELPVNGVSAPVDSLFGFEVLQRTPVRERKEYAMSAIGIRFELDVPDAAPNSRASASRLANELADQIRQDPTRFEALQGQYCCRGVTRFREGRAFPGVVRAFEHMAIGQVATVPIEAAGQFVIPRRVQLDDDAPLPVSVDLDFVGPPDTAYLLSHMDSPTARAQLEAVLTQVVARQELDGERAARLRELHERPWQSGAPSQGERQEALVALASPLEQLLGPAGYSAYVSLLERQLERLLLRAPQN
jgi:hypothetical protein